MARASTGRDPGSPTGDNDAPSGPLEGLVAAVWADRCQVHAGDAVWVCWLRGRLRKAAAPVVGDRVRIEPQPDGTAAVAAVHPRRNSLVRGASERKRGRRGPPQVLAANVDRLVIVAAVAEPSFRPGLVDRFLVAAALAEAAPVICINKLDLDPGGAFAAIAAQYAHLHLPVLGTSTARPETLTPLAAALAGRTNVLVGHSGVGKTSLLNALAGQQRPVGDLDAVQRGRHTTTTAQLIALRGGGHAIDSPGIREFGLHGIGEAELAGLFPDFAGFRDRCGFRDCLHRGEPRCAVRAAVEAGEVPAGRYESYLKLLEEVAGA